MEAECAVQPRWDVGIWNLIKFHYEIKFAAAQNVLPWGAKKKLVHDELAWWTSIPIHNIQIHIHTAPSLSLSNTRRIDADDSKPGLNEWGEIQTNKYCFYLSLSSETRWACKYTGTRHRTSTQYGARVSVGRKCVPQTTGMGRIEDTRSEGSTPRLPLDYHR